jgi:phosphate acetyltransferase
MNANALPAKALIENVTYDELRVGQSARLVRKLTLGDIQAFALVSGDFNPAHLDPEYAQGTNLHQVVAHGMWGGALISSVLGTTFPGAGTIYVEQTLQFKHPVHVGDSLTVVLTVLSKDDSSKQVRLDCDVVNQRGIEVISGVATVVAPVHKVSRHPMEMPAMHLFDPHARLNQWVDSFKGLAPVHCAVVHPCDHESLKGALDAAYRGLIIPHLVGPESRLRALADVAGLDLHGIAIEAVPHSHAAAARAAELAANGQVHALMKGSLHTDELMHAVISTPALRTKRRLSHVFRFDIPTYPKPLLLTDAAINITPSLDEKVDIVQNAIDLAHFLGVALPKVAILSAVEMVTSRMSSTLDAAAMCKMAQRGQITGGMLDGPLAFDNAISAEAARVKGIDSAVSGDADILVVPDLEAGNMLAKLLEYLAGAASCGVVMGARVPIALTSRSDGAQSRMASAALAALVARGTNADAAGQA